MIKREENKQDDWHNQKGLSCNLNKPIEVETTVEEKSGTFSEVKG
jgi:hypothetical protein